MKDRVGQVWQLTLVEGEPIVLILATNAVDRMHRVLVLDSSRWEAGQIRTLGTLGNWDDANLGWERLA